MANKKSPRTHKDDLRYCLDVAKRHLSSCEDDLRQTFRHIHYTKEWLRLVEKSLDEGTQKCHLSQIENPPDKIYIGRD